MTYCTKDMGWEELYNISKLNKYFLANTEQYPLPQEQRLIIFEDKKEMLNHFISHLYGFENHNNQIAIVVGYHKVERTVTWVDQTWRIQNRNISFYIPKIKWENES